MWLNGLRSNIATTAAWIRSLTQELPHVMGMAKIKKQQQQKKTETKAGSKKKSCKDESKIIMYNTQIGLTQDRP